MSNTREVPLKAVDDMHRILPAPNTADVTIEVVGEDVGDQVAADHLAWHGVTYDSRNDVIEVSVGGRREQADVVLRHAIHRPARVWIEEREGIVHAISVESGDSPTTIIRFHERHALGGGGAPAPLGTT